MLIYHVDATVWNGAGPVRVRRAQADDPALAGYYDCGPAYNAAYDVGDGEGSVFEEGDLRVEVLASTESGYTVRATLAGEPEPETHDRAVAIALKKHLRVLGSVTSPTGPPWPSTPTRSTPARPPGRRWCGTATDPRPIVVTGRLPEAGRGGSMKTTAVAAAVLCLGLVAGCSSSEDPEPDPATLPSATGESGPSVSETSGSGSPSGSATPRASPADGPVVAFDPAGQTTFEETDVRDVATGTDTLLTLTGDTLRARSLPALEEAWTAVSDTGSFADLWARPGSRWGYTLEVRTVAGTGTKVGYDEITVRRFDLASGREDGKASTRVPQDPRGSSGPATGRIVSVQGSRVVVDSAVADSGAVHATAVLDPAAGRTAWKSRGAEALVATRRVVVVNTGTPDAAGSVDARDLATGKRRWTALPGTLAASAVGADARSVVVARDDNVFAEHSLTSLSLRTGRAGATQVTTDAEWSCDPASSSVAVCTLPEADQVVGWNLRRNRARWTLPTASRFAPTVTLVQDKLVYGLLDSGAGVVLRAITGADVKDSGGAAPKAVNAWGGVVHYGDRAIFVPASGAGAPAATESPAVPASPTASETSSPSGDPTSAAE